MRGKSRVRGLLVCLSVAAGLAAAGPAAGAPGQCPTVLPTAGVNLGAVGKGYTVDKGTTVKPFDVTVLGVLPNGIGPGRDMIVVETASPAIDAAGGIWFGMSGSPVYVGGKLIGALAYGLTFGPSKVAGLTPASDLLTVAGYPAAAAGKASTTIRLPRYLASRVARATGRSVAAASSLSRLKTPLSISGVHERGMPRVRQMIKRKRLAAIPYQGSSASASATASSSEVVPGGNFAAALSYGDITMAGVGTTSYVCDGKAIAFGHPFTWTGATAMGANAASALGVVADPIFGAFKLANIGGSVGVLDQDRLAGIRAQLGPAPATTPIGSRIASLDTGRSRLGQTDAVVDEFLPDLAFFHLFSNIDSVFDTIGPGTSDFRWTIRGKLANGHAWTFHHGNLYASEFDISWESSFELANELFAIGLFRREGIVVDDIFVSGEVEETVRRLDLVRVLVKRNGEYRRVGQELRARPRQLVRLRVVLHPAQGGPNQNVDFAVRMPRNLDNGALIEIVGAPSGEECVDESCEEATPASFTALLEKLRAQRRNNVLVTRLLAGPSFRPRAAQRRTFDQYVQANRMIFVVPPGGASGGEGVAVEGVSRLR